MNDPVFTPDQTVICHANGGYTNHLTTGKEYKVLEYDPTYRTETFTFPAYVAVEGDMGGRVVAHASRFRLKGESETQAAT